MKKQLFLMLCIFCASISSYANEAAKCALQHKGNVTMYNASDIEKAISAAVDGDTLFLTSGTFNGFTIDKKITVRGSGQASYVGPIIINIPNSPKVTNSVLEGLYINGNITLQSEMDGVKIKQCKFQSLIVNKTNDNVKIDRCFVSNTITQNEYLKGLQIVNSKIYCLAGSSKTSINCYFINCNIYRIDQRSSTSYVSGYFNNCIIDEISSNASSYFNAYNCTMKNTLHACNWSIYESSSETNCYQDVYMSINSATLDCGYDDTKLQSKGFLGSDGTVVGCNGGSTPFTLELAIPKVTSSKISLDTSKKVLNVSIKVSAK